MNQFKKSKIVMLPTEKANPQLFYHCPIGLPRVLSTGQGKLYHQECIKSGLTKPQHLYFLSDEEIKEGDWAIPSNSTNGKITDFEECKPFVAKSNYGASVYVLKIISSTDPELKLPRPSDKFLKKFVEKQGIWEVMVEYESSRKYGMWKPEYYPQILKVAPDNTITIKPVKDSWNREDLNELNQKLDAMEKDSFAGWSEEAKNGYITATVTIRKWIEQNL